MFNLQKICRTCLTTARELLPVTAIIDTEKQINDYFEIYLHYPIQQDELPQSICLRCLDKLLEVKKFFQQCKESEEYLREEIKKENDKIREDINLKTEDDTEEIFMIENLSQEDSNTSDGMIEYTSFEALNTKNTEDSSQEYVCTVCNENFDHEKVYKMHMEIYHDVQDDSNEISLKQESESDKEGSKLKEENDDVKKKSKTAYWCEICHGGFKFKKKYDQHMLKHENKPVYKCTQCEKTFSSEERRNKHISVAHEGHTGDESCVCPKCGLKYRNSKYLQVHLQSHNEDRKKYACDYCDKTFFRKDSLNCHIRTHTGEKPFECEICHRKFSQKNALATHMSLHTGKTVKCPLCDKMFSRPSFLKVHNREHTDERPYACDMCPKRYRQKSHLRAHQFVHFNKRPFSCDICGKSYSQKSTLRQHLFVHTGKPYKCPVCEMKFARPYRFRQHMINVHNINDDPQKYKENANSEQNDNEEEMSNDHEFDIIRTDSQINITDL